MMEFDFYTTYNIWNSFDLSPDGLKQTVSEPTNR